MAITGIRTRLLPAPGRLQRDLRLSSTSTAVRKEAWSDPKSLAPLSRLPTKTLLRSLVLTSLMSRQWIMRPSLALLSVMSKSKAAIMNPDMNPILNKLMRWTIYNHFAAGTSLQEVAKSSKEIKTMGYQGIILGYAKEVVLDDPAETGTASNTQDNEYRPCHYEVVEEWKNGTLETLRMVGPGDFLAVKITGAGPVSVDAMKARKEMPEVVADAMEEICRETRKQGSRLWIDAEQQGLQPALDDWTIQLMRQHNKRDEKPLVYNTIQAYLKGSRENVDRHITLAAEEGWTVAVKLVRGAYIDHEVRSLIHDTKEQTDRCYDELADAFISQKMPPEFSHLEFPSSALFLATHNAASATKAFSTYSERVAAGLPTTQTMECGQIMGMADELSCQLLQAHERAVQGEQSGQIPGVFKCLTWGSVAECLGYLHRRAVENRGAVERTQHMVQALKKELRRRWVG